MQNPFFPTCSQLFGWQPFRFDTLHVKVLRLLGDKKTIEFETGTLNYSATTKVYYEQDELDVCVLVDALEDDLVEGTYTINVFDGPNQVATTTMQLK